MIRLADWARAARLFLGILGCSAILLLLGWLLDGVEYHAIAHALRGIRLRVIAIAGLMTAFSYAAILVRDRYALTSVGAELPASAVRLAAFCGTAIDNVVGWGPLSGRAVRARIFGALISSEQLQRSSILRKAGFALGLLSFAGLGLIFADGTLSRLCATPPMVLHLLGVVMMILIVAAIAWCAWQTDPIKVGDWSISLPTAGSALRQALLSLVDVTASAAALWILLPGIIGFADYAVIFSAALALAVVSRIPAGLGVFEIVIFAALRGSASPSYTIAALLAYRGVYFALPLLLAAASLAGFQLRRPGVRSAADQLIWARAGRLSPMFLSVVTFAMGAMLIVSGATPAVDWRLAALQGVLPLWAVEISHLLATLAGVFLLFVARGLYYRLDGAWWLAFIVALANVGFSLSKGLAFGETAALLLLVFLLLATRPQFTRPAAFLGQPFTAGWFVAIAVVIAAAIGILLFAFRDIPYRREIWWQFEFDARASRSMRAILGASIFALAISLWQMMRAAPGLAKLPSDEQLERVAELIKRQERTSALLGLMGDKSILFSDSNKSFLMYAKRGRSWVALFDPVGPRSEWPEMVWRFVELVHSHGGRAAFYQICPEGLPIYLDAGLQVMKVGEEACIALNEFGLEGPERYGLRQAVRRAERERMSFDVLESAEVAARLGLLREISDAWLASHHASERRFSVASFEPRFLAAQTVVLSMLCGKPLAFITFMTTESKTEATVGLMRYAPEAPPYLMEFLLTRLALALRAEGYRTLSLGMAPLAGLVRTPLSSTSHRIARSLWEHGGAFYNFQGLRSFKNKFRPVWEPRYVAASGAFGPFLTLADVAALASGYVRAH